MTGVVGAGDNWLILSDSCHCRIKCMFYKVVACKPANAKGVSKCAVAKRIAFRQLDIGHGSCGYPGCNTHYSVGRIKPQCAIRSIADLHKSKLLSLWHAETGG